jgi:hypothetical protein
LKKSRYGAIDGFVVFTGFPDASTVLPDASVEEDENMLSMPNIPPDDVGLPDASTGLPDASTGLPDASVEDDEDENMLPIPNIPPDDVVLPDASTGLPDASVVESEENNENGSNFG